MAFRVEQQTLDALEWSAVVERLADACHTERARHRLLDGLVPSPAEDSSDSAPPASNLFEQTRTGVLERLRETDEARSLLDEDELPPLGSTPDIAPLLGRAERGDVLEAESLLAVRGVIETLRGISRYLVAPQRAARAPSLAGAAAAIDAPTPLEREIDRCIEPGGEIRDAASPALAEARRESIRLAADLQRRLERYLQSTEVADHLSDRYFTVRNDRYVLPVKADARGRVRGIVHDSSRSGTTLFIEPEGVVEMNNGLKRAALDVKREIERILQRLSADVAAVAPALRVGLEALTHIDLAFARGRLSEQMDAHSPSVGEDGVFDLPDLRHPLIDPRDCVPNDIRLGDEYQVLVLSGPNAGGKTVALKATALAALFVRAGLHVACGPGGRADLVQEVIAEIGDGQDIGESLSTFSAHMASLSRIVARAGRHALIVLDEVGVGTDPSEGAALAQAILERLADSGARVITTTHYNLLKEMADVDPRFANASVEFDPETLAPTYRLRMGEPGSSSAAAVASRMGMPSSVLERADALMQREDRQLDRMLTELAASRSTLESERANVARLRAESEAVRDEYRSKLERLQERRDELFRSMRKDLDSAFELAHREVAGVIRDLQRGPTSQNAAAARERLGELAVETRAAEAAAGLPEDQPAAPGLVPIDWRHVRAGDPVRLATGREGVLVSLPDRRGRATVRVGDARLLVSTEQIGRGSTPPPRDDRALRFRIERARPAPDDSLLEGGTLECDIRGMRVDEAIGRLQETVDRAAADGRDGLRVIHGHGTGALRRAVREHLSETELVIDLRPGAEDEGGEGVTIAQLR